jgi:tripartite-type tricarboxylate transporter receptor subunit TctC
MLALAAALPAAAQEFPSRPVRLVVPFPPGGPLDLAGRLIGQHLSERWAQPVVIENKPGSSIGPDFVAKSAPDGHTLLIISSTPLVTLPQMEKAPYDVLRDLVGVTQTTLLTYALMVTPQSGIHSMQDLIERARREPGRINYASAGKGSGQHLLMELLKTAAGIDITHVPYKGSAPAMQGVLGGQVEMMLDVTTTVVPHVRSSRARAILVTGAKSLEQLPGATPIESLFPGIDIQNWHGIFAPGATPKPVLDRIAADVRQVLALPAVGNRFQELGTETSGVSGERFNEIVRRDYERWGDIIRKNNLRSN